MKIQLKNCRLAFPAIFEAKTVNGEGKPAFSASLIFAKDSANVKAINSAIDAVGKEKWNDKAAKILTTLRKDGKVCLHDGDDKEYDGFADNFYVSARSPTRPLVLDADAKTPLVQADGRPYGGCYVNAVVEIWAQDSQYGKRVNATLKGVQFVKDGDAFGGGAPASPDDFEAVEEGADAGDLV